MLLVREITTALWGVRGRRIVVALALVVYTAIIAILIVQRSPWWAAITLMVILFGALWLLGSRWAGQDAMKRASEPETEG